MSEYQGSGSETEDMVPETILDKKICYFVKWKGRNEAQNSWEPEVNLECLDLIKEFEAQRSEVEQVSDAPVCEENENMPSCSSSAANGNPRTGRESARPVQIQTSGFDLGLEAEQIVGATDSSGELMYVIKFRESDRVDLVPARVANANCPQVVIAFFQERINWSDSSNADVVDLFTP